MLIIANSGRMLAQAAHRNGLKPVVIDVFADIDTQFFARDSYKITALSNEYLIPVMNEFIQRYSLTHALFGSGFECYPGSLQYLNDSIIVLGNNYNVFVRLQDKKFFFSTLDALDIPHPEVSFSEPSDRDWLIKPMLGHGGVGIKRFNFGCNIPDYVYWQKYKVGTQQSVLFLADGQNAEVVGFNTQWTTNINEKEEFTFCGIMNSCDLPYKNKQVVLGWLAKLVPTFSLVGLNSLDFLYVDGVCLVLEINPRPPASMQLYDADLLSRHIRASQGVLTYDLPIQARITGYQIVYADYDLVIPPRFVWPSRVVDIPKDEALIRKGQPICSIIAHEKNPQLVFAQLRSRQQQLIKNLIRY